MTLVQALSNAPSRPVHPAALAPAPKRQATPAAPDPASAQAGRALGRMLLAARTAQAGAAGGALVIPRARRPVGPDRLAASQGGGALARNTARALYERCLRHFREHVRPSRPEHAGMDDLASVAAHFVAANFQALYGVQVDERTLQALQHQLAPLFAAAREWARGSLAERQAFVEKLAIVSVLIHESHAHAQAHGPVALAPVRQAARGYLHEMLGIDPDGLTLDERGLTLADAA